MEQPEKEPGLLTHIVALPLFLIVMGIALIIRYRILQLTVGAIVLIVIIGLISNATG